MSKGGLVKNDTGDFPGYLLSSDDIDNYLRSKIKGRFKGVFRTSEIVNKKEGFTPNSWSVLNLDNDGEGTHWVVLGKSRKGIFVYYDPLGSEHVPQEILDNFAPLATNTEQQQSLASTACGLYCIKFILAQK